MSGIANPKVSGRGLARFEFLKTPPSGGSSKLIQKVNRKPHFTKATTMGEEDIEKPSKRKRNGAEAKPEKQCQRSAKEQEVADIEDMFSDKETQIIRASLLDWYDHNQRDLPWRRITQTKENLFIEEEEEEEEGERRAYGVWVSEVMLQQTRVQTVIDYYNRWMLKWPTPHHLAQASLEEVNEMWAGLGYYRRARFLLEGAKMIVAGRDGFPKKFLPCGSGSFQDMLCQVVPVVDGNVIRVLARLKAISENPKDKVAVMNFWKLAGQLVDPYRPGDFNQSLMELGATLCTPVNPSCSSCPVSGQCRALTISKQDKLVLVTDYPAKSKKLKQRHEFSAVCVVEISGGQDLIEGDQSSSVFLLVKRPDEGLLAGLWEFPSVMLGKEADLTRRRKEMNHFLKKSFRLDPQRTCSILLREEIGDFIHIFSHIRLKLYVELLVVHLKGDMGDWFSKQDRENLTWKCVDCKTLSSLGLTSGVRKITVTGLCEPMNRYLGGLCTDCVFFDAGLHYGSKV
ncbi:unnamed protein product [Dovyalis caffra]|uniref:Adenine DNA glycosylase n=1 Tax=Dovyalis caffra TaxID=77055 RepID=A0AAV1SEH5_9ROSI|nr:unnamed protein product [Dovyalis caffra]